MAQDYKNFTQEDWDKAMKKFLEEGGKIQQVPYGSTSDASTDFYGNKKKDKDKK
jgi:hypothetical protein